MDLACHRQPRSSDIAEQKPLHPLRSIVFAVAVASAFAGCERAGPEPDAPATIEGAAACVEGGGLTVSVYGGLEGELDWSGGTLRCEGMRRPHGQGARLRFEGPAPDDASGDRLAFIIALPDLVRGETATELPAGVTLMEVNAGRFFSTPEQPACWVDVERHESTGSAGDDYRISGLLYCVSPLAEVNGSANVTLRDLHFTGRLDWSDPE